MISFFKYSLFPIFVSLLIHALIFGALLFSWESQPKPEKKPAPKFIEAKLVKLKEQTVKKAAAKQPKKIDLAAKRREQERLKREAEQKRQAQIQKEKELKAKKEAEKRKQEELQKQREREEELERERKNKQRLQQEFEEALKQEQGMLMDRQYEIEAQSYSAKIRERIEQNWNRPPSARTGMRCTLRIQLVPTGRVVNVDVIESSGNSAFDRSAVQAVKKVETFPEIKDMPLALFEREFRQFSLVFNPQDLRL